VGVVTFGASSESIGKTNSKAKLASYTIRLTSMRQNSLNYIVTPDIVMDVTDAIRERLEHGRLGVLTPELQVCILLFTFI